MGRSEQAWRRINPVDSFSEYQVQRKLSRWSMISPWAYLDKISLGVSKKRPAVGAERHHGQFAHSDTFYTALLLESGSRSVRSQNWLTNHQEPTSFAIRWTFDPSCITCEPLNEHPTPRASGLRQIPGRCSGRSQIRSIYCCRRLERKSGSRSGSASPPLISSVCGTTYNQVLYPLIP